MADSFNKKNRHWIWSNKFYSITQIAGFGFINAASSRLERTFWYILIIIFTTVMIRDVFKLSKQWHDNKTVTSMTVQSNKTIFLPPSTLCIVAKVPDYNWDYPTALLNPVSRYPWWDRLNKSLENLSTKKKILKANWVRDHYHFLPLANRYFAFLTHSENVHETTENYDSINYKRRIFSENDDHFIPGERYPAGKVTRHFIKKIKKLITEKELTKKFSDEIASLFSLTISWRRESSRRGVDVFNSSFARLSWSDGNKICFQIDFGADVYLGNSKVLMVSASYNLADKIEQKPEYYSFGYRRRTWHVNSSRLDFHLNSAVPPPEVADLAVLYQHSKTATIAVDKIMHSHVTKGCSESYQTLEQCEKNCRVSLINSKCGCVPLTQGNKTTENQTCTIGTYLRCLEYSTNDDSDCKESCQPPCTRVNYRLDEKSVEKLDQRMIRFLLSYRRTDFPVFNEEYANSWQNFIGDLGGIVDFWLGTSFIGVIHLVVHLMKQCCYCGDKYREEKKRNFEENLEPIEVPEEKKNGENAVVHETTA